MTRLLISIFIFGAAFLSGFHSVFETSFYTKGLVSLVEEIKTVEAQNFNDDLYFVGDVFLGRNIERLMEQNGYGYPYENFSFASDSIVVGNFEATIPEVHVPTADFTYTFSVKSEALPYLYDAGFTHMSLANNHSYDFGVNEYFNTIEELKTAKIESFGDQNISTSTTAVVSWSGKKVLLLGLYAVDVYPNLETLSQLISDYPEVDLVIAYIHWGNEYELEPSAFQRDLAVALIDLGIDLIVGHHPHVVQSIEVINGVPVFYSLGNFIFDQYFSQEVQDGLVLKLHEGGDGEQVELLPVTSMNSFSAPRFMESEETVSFLEKLSSYSDLSIKNDIKSGLVKLKY